MDRRESLKKIAFGSLIPTLTNGFNSSFLDLWKTTSVDFMSDWHRWPDMKWLGPEYWSNPLQDWELIDGKATCVNAVNNRNFHLLTIQKNEDLLAFETRVHLEFHKSATLKCAGLRLGAKGPFPDHRSAAVFGNGLDIGLNENMDLVVGEETIPTQIDNTIKGLVLNVSARPDDDSFNLEIQILDLEGKKIAEYLKTKIKPEILTGNFALVSDFDSNLGGPGISFSNWKISSDELLVNQNNTFGPICFAQYTINKGILKITAQCCPVESVNNNLLSFQVKQNNEWKTLASEKINDSSRAINFRLNDWDHQKDLSYQLLLELPLKNSIEQFTYEGTIVKEPFAQNEIRAAVFSCNFHHGFPDSDIPENVSKLNPDIILFLGDQFYEGTGGYGVLSDGPPDKLVLDYLRKWYMFGWSYRDLFRHRPCAIIPDDHDMYHGNIWGEAGKKADTSNGFYAPAQDSGGYKMSPEWVNMVQFTQTSHLPDAFDPTPVKQGISVYFTHWNYGGISFAILEDRKFKSAPKNVLPPEAEVYNGWIMNEEFDIKQYKHLKADQLGNRQYKFLNNWVEDWSNEAEFKVALSQTNFATVATLPVEEKTGSNIPRLPIPEYGQYPKNEKATVDMDSNGWPSAERDKAISILRKGFAFHIAGDQHLPTFIQYGLDEHGDSGHAFAGPALNNIWPRRFWPTVDTSKHSMKNPAYLGNHLDGFGNRMTVKAVANPHKTGKEPKIIHDRSTGFGLVTFNKEKRTIKTECWPRFVDPTKPGTQYPDWPIEIHQSENYARKAKAWLPTIHTKNVSNPVIQIRKNNGELVYSLRIKGNKFQAKVFEKGIYNILIEGHELGQAKELKSVKSRKKNSEIIEIEL